ncbi:MAG: DUF362 domain-containing protein [Candidatus Geothermincolales bacterium]
MTVAVVRAEGPRDLARALELLGGMENYVKKGERILVKPNICAGRPSSTGTVTDPELVAEICRLVKEAGAEPVVGESPIHPFRSARVFKRAGYGDFEERYGFPLLDLDGSEAVAVRVPRGKVLREVRVAKPVLECQGIINVPVLKTHLQTIVTLGLKNLKGLVPGEDKVGVHVRGLDEGIVDLNTLFPSRLVVVDALVGMEGELGPTNGRPVELGLLVVGDNVVEVDATCCRIIGLDPRRVPHIRRAEERGIGRTQGFRVLGEDPERVKRQFDLPDHPELNKFMITSVLLHIYHYLRRPLDLLSGRGRGPRPEGRVGLKAELCDGCAVCERACPVSAVTMADSRPAIDGSACILCFCCAEACPRGALYRART